MSGATPSGAKQSVTIAASITARLSSISPTIERSLGPQGGVAVSTSVAIIRRSSRH